MYLNKHEDINTFLHETQNYLEQNEGLNNLMLGICNRIKNNLGYYDDVYMATVRENDELVLTAIMTVPQKLIVYSNATEFNEATELLINDLISRSIYIPGVVGPKELSKRVCEIWSKYVTCNIKLEMNMRVYELREVNRDLIGQGVFRVANENDLDFIAQGIYEFEIDAGLNNEPDKEKCYEVGRARLVEKTIFVWEDEGKVVSMAAKTRPTQNGATIALVYTPKNLRGKGYATSCVASLSQHLLDTGYKFCTLFTDLANPVSNSIYMKIGYKSVGDFDGYIFQTIESRCGILCSSCEYKESMGCKGCTLIEKPFWGETCPVKSCCERKELDHCGNCDAFPCELLTQFSYDEEQGDNGRRIEQCKKWSGKKEGKNEI